MTSRPARSAQAAKSVTTASTRVDSTALAALALTLSAYTAIP
ncbi:hypothetical protein [Actinokineospora fastidiosa]|nr:hypothetical protein [Actinokineospora fastidiosa]